MDIIKISNIENYTQQIINGDLILTPKPKYITEDEFMKLNLTLSKIISCDIREGNNIISDKIKYNTILTDILNYINDVREIYKITKINIKPGNENRVNGFIWNSKLNLSIQQKDANGTMKEIFNIIQIKKYLIDITIQLESNHIIKFKN
jgi:hypothetical protein